MADYIEIHDLLLRTIVGVNPEEQQTCQDVILKIRMQADLRAAGQSDDIDQTVNYRTICKQIIQHVEPGRFQLVERIAEDVAAICLQNPRVLRVWVSVEKPGALRFARSVGVQIERGRDAQ